MFLKSQVRATLGEKQIDIAHNVFPAHLRLRSPRVIPTLRRVIA